MNYDAKNELEKGRIIDDLPGLDAEKEKPSIYQGMLNRLALHKMENKPKFEEVTITQEEADKIIFTEMREQFGLPASAVAMSEREAKEAGLVVGAIGFGRNTFHMNPSNFVESVMNDSIPPGTDLSPLLAEAEAMQAELQEIARKYDGYPNACTTVDVPRMAKEASEIIISLIQQIRKIS